jgi:hypothetical protein
MAIDTSVYGLIRQPQAPNLLGQVAQVQQIQAQQDQNKLAKLAFQDRERQQADQQRLRGIYGQGLQGDALENALLRGGFANEALKFGTDRRANAKSDADTQATHIATATKKLEALGQGLGYLKDNPTIENARALVSGWQQAGLITPEEAQQKLTEFGQDPTPQGVQRLALMGYQGALSAKDQLATYATRNLGGTTQTTAINPVTGQVRVVDTQTNTVSPDAQLQSQTSIANNIRTTEAMKDNAQATRDAAKTTSGIKNEQDLRKEFEGLPEVKNYKQAYPALAAIRDAATRNTTQSDINIVYGLAKLYDPNSVVREGEYATVANSPNIPERIKGYAQYLQGGGRLTPEVKAQILAEAEGRAKTYENETNKARASYEEIARRNNIDPRNVFTSMGDIGPGAPSPSPKDAGRVRKYNPATGKIE